MREIKFRGKRLYDGGWIYGSLLVSHFKDDKKERYFITQFSGNYTFEHEVDPATVGQYTGLKDKNGEKIYEGDIIGGSNGSINGMECPFKSEIKWNDKECGFNTPNWGYMDSTHYYNVLGNIHDNPELLK